MVKWSSFVFVVRTIVILRVVRRTLRVFRRNNEKEVPSENHRNEASISKTTIEEYDETLRLETSSRKSTEI